MKKSTLILIVISLSHPALQEVFYGQDTVNFGTGVTHSFANVGAEDSLEEFKNSIPDNFFPTHHILGNAVNQLITNNPNGPYTSENDAKESRPSPFASSVHENRIRNGEATTNTIDCDAWIKRIRNGNGDCKVSRRIWARCAAKFIASYQQLIAYASETDARAEALYEKVQSHELQINSIALNKSHHAFFSQRQIDRALHYRK